MLSDAAAARQCREEGEKKKARQACTHWSYQSTAIMEMTGKRYLMLTDSELKRGSRTVLSASVGNFEIRVGDTPPSQLPRKD